MTMKFLVATMALGAAMAAPAYAQDSEIGYPKGSLAYDALMSSDYARAEKQLRSDYRVHRDDPAKLINYGLALAETGNLDDARKAFQKALSEDEVELIMADGRTMGSHDVARQGIELVKSKRTAQR